MKLKGGKVALNMKSASPVSGGGGSGKQLSPFPTANIISNINIFIMFTICNITHMASTVLNSMENLYI